MSNSRPDYILSDPGNYRRVKHLSHDHISPSDIEAAYRTDIGPSTYVERWTPGPHLHSHVCPDCGGASLCEEPECGMPPSCRCIECWARECGSPLPGATFILLTLAAGLALTVGFFWLVLG